MIDPVALTRDLVRRNSVTPEDDGAQDVLAGVLETAGFAVERLVFVSPDTAPVSNLFATVGEGRPHLALNGHTDVVPPGDPTAWRFEPFGAAIEDGRLYGRGATDMKSGVAAFAAAAVAYLERHGPPPGRLSLLVTGDEEGEAVNGTVRLIDWALAKGHRFDACVVGEPTSIDQLGDTAKIGRRGSYTVRLKAMGVQGHVGYPHRADNAAHRMVQLLDALLAEPLDGGSEHFDPSTLQVTTIDVANPTPNVVPGAASAVVNVRFNDLWTPESLEAELRRRLDAVGGYAFQGACSARSFLTAPGSLSGLVQDAVESVTGRRPGLSTTGGTSDARFFAPVCPVVEFGLTGRTMHQVDEHVAIDEVRTLADAYLAIIERFFEQVP